MSGTIAPGNSSTIGTLNVNGNYTQNAGSTYKVKVGSQSDLINITGNATINGGTVDVHAVAGVTPKTYSHPHGHGRRRRHLLGCQDHRRQLQLRFRLRDTASHNTTRTMSS